MNTLCLRAGLLSYCIACLGVTALADYEAAVLALNPTHYWRLNETAEGMAVDSAGDLDGTHQGIFGEGFGEIGALGPPVPGLEPGNLAFGANNAASIGIGDGAALAASTMTVAGWFLENGSEGGDRFWTNNQTDPNTSFQIFFGGGSGDVAANIGIGLNPDVNGFPVEGLPSGSGVGNFHIPDSIVPVKDGLWHHIVASRNGNNIENVIVVIDGVNYDISTWRDSTDTWGTTGTDAQIATRTPPDGGAALQAMNGPVDEVAVWLDRQLTVEEAIGLYQAAIDTVTPVAGDYDDSGQVAQGDLDLVLLNWGDAVPPAPSGWINEVPTDGLVSQNELDGVLLNWGDTGGAAAVAGVPEPTTSVLAFLACLATCLASGRRHGADC